MSSAIMTLIGLYNYDHTLFDGFDNLPAGIDKGLLVDTVIMRGGEYEVLYPNPDLLKSLISSWSTRYYPLISNWLKAQSDIAEVNPLENYDRYEEWEDNESGQHSNTTSSSSQSASTDTMSGSGSTSGSDNTSGSASTTGTDTVSAFDSNTLVNDKGTSQSNTTTTESTTSTTSQTSTSSNATTNGSASESVTGSDSKAGTHEGHIHGNIGVTTAGAMYREFLDIIGKYGNIYESVATIFLQSFVIPLV